MTDKCAWCSSSNIFFLEETVYWELPDGSRAIAITDTPTISCRDCGIFYQDEKIVKMIEDQLFLINTKDLGKEVSFEKLMGMKRLLKRNYFDFNS